MSVSLRLHSHIAQERLRHHHGNLLTGVWHRQRFGRPHERPNIRTTSAERPPQCDRQGRIARKPPTAATGGARRPQEELKFVVFSVRTRAAAGNTTVASSTGVLLDVEERSRRRFGGSWNSSSRWWKWKWNRWAWWQPWCARRRSFPQQNNAYADAERPPNAVTKKPKHQCTGASSGYDLIECERRVEFRW